MKKKFTLRLNDHLPYSKTRGQVSDSSCFLEVKDNPEAWIEITLQEIYTLDGSKRQMSRTIMACLDAEQRAALLKYLLSDEKTNGKD